MSILSTPREDYVLGVDIALNCLDLLNSVAVSGSNEGVVRLWDTQVRFSIISSHFNITFQSGTMKHRLDWSEFGAVNSVKLISSGEELHLLSGHDDGQLVVSRVSPETVSTVKIISQHQNILWSIDVTSQLVATCSEDATVAVYSREETLTSPGLSPEPRYQLTGHTSAVTSLSLSGNILASGSRDRTVIVWALRAPGSHYSVLAVLQVFVILSPLLTSSLLSHQGHQEILHYVAQDQDRIYSSDDNGELFVWNKQKILEGGEGGQGREVEGNKENLILRRVNYGEERGAIDCIVIRGEAKEILL